MSDNEIPDSNKIQHIHICLVSEQPIPNLTTVFSFSPDLIVLLKTREISKKSYFLEEVLKDKGFNFDAETIDAYDINNVILVIKRLIEKYRGHRLSLNITGGTKLSAVGAYKAFADAGKEIYYVDTSNDRIMQICPEQKEMPIDVKISIRDYLRAYGFNIKTFVQNDEDIIKRKDITDLLFENALKNPYSFYDLKSELHRYGDKPNFPISIKLRKDKTLELKSVLLKLDGVSEIGENKIAISDESTYKYIKGAWFEEYVYLIAKDVSPDEIMLNVYGEWSTYGEYAPKNEFDIVLSKRNRLFIISCKTADPNRDNHNRDDKKDKDGVGKEFIYELVSLGDRALGLFGGRMLVSLRPVDRAVKERAKIMNVGIVDGKDIYRLRDFINSMLNRYK